MLAMSPGKSLTWIQTLTYPLAKESYTAAMSGGGSAEVSYTVAMSGGGHAKVYNRQ